MYCIVSPFSRSFDDIGMIYIVPKFLEKQIKIGNIVEIPIKQKIEIGVVINITPKIEINLDITKIRTIISIQNSHVFLHNYQKEILPWIAKYYFSTIHQALNLFFPKNLKEKILKNTITKQIQTSIASKQNGNLYEYTYFHKMELTPEQSKAYTKITNTTHNKILLYGVTGSGKTEIYVKLIKDMLDAGKQSLFLIPEIILTTQLAQRMKEVFGKKVIVLNSTISEGQKTKYWIDIYNDNAKLIVGTRSALFYPFKNLGLIIIDEEHDNSYISDSFVRYNTIEVAEKITHINKNKLILGSGTPSIKSMYQSVKGEYYLIQLLKKY